jgi:hypothetical protein
MTHTLNFRIAGLVWLCACMARADNSFTLIDYPNASSTQAWGINSQGDIAGYTPAPITTATAFC